MDKILSATHTAIAATRDEASILLESTSSKIELMNCSMSSASGAAAYFGVVDVLAFPSGGGDPRFLKKKRMRRHLKAPLYSPKKKQWSDLNERAAVRCPASDP
eukprot:SAG11_NODE_365_length_10153_cov_3.204695_5_plen_103_part_00